MIPYFQKEPSDLDKAIASTFKDLEGFSADDDEFADIVEQQLKLHSLKPQRLDPNKLIVAATYAFITIAVLNFERSGGLVSTKIWSFLPKNI